jgi:hypothetical protein
MAKSAILYRYERCEYVDQETKNESSRTHNNPPFLTDKGPATNRRRFLLKIELDEVGSADFLTGH